jgi:hypothetical protein
MTRLRSALVIAAFTGASTPAWPSCEASIDFWQQANACGQVFVGHVVGYPPSDTGPGIIVAVDAVLQSRVPQQQVTLVAPWGPFNSRSAPAVGSRFVFVLARLEGSDTYTTDAGECSEPAMQLIDALHGVAWFRKELDRRAAMARPALEASCAAGRDTACYQLGCMYQEGHGIRRDSGRAATLFRRALELQWE